MTMKKGVYIFVVGLLIHVWSGKALETVWLKDVTTTFLTEKRTSSDIDLPNEIAFHLTRHSKTLNLNLRRNHDINPNPNFYFARKLKNGQTVLVKSRNVEKEDVAYYQDINNWAFMTVRCVKKSNEQCDRIINGNIRIGYRNYYLRPVEMDVASRNMLEDSGIIGKEYVLQDQTHTQREYTVEEKDVAQGNEKNIEQKRMFLFRRFHEQRKQKHLSSRIVSALRNRAETDESRQLRDVYIVNIAVLIDSGLWDFYKSTVHSSIPLIRNSQAKKKIKQVYSHIMNGVHMIYKGIKDNSISINVFLNDFIIFKTKNEFPHNESKEVQYNGTHYIDADPYLNDIIKWDMKTAVRDQPSFGHGMLFTRYKLYEKYLNKTELGGLAYIDNVCSVGKRMSVVEVGDYVWMVSVAAHELGHNLGAYHDGEGKAKACKAEDLFIMSPINKGPSSGKPYSENPWLFSNCSVEEFKVTLKNKYSIWKVPKRHFNVCLNKSENSISCSRDIFGIERLRELIYEHILIR